MPDMISIPVVLTGLASALLCYALVLRVLTVVNEKSSQRQFIIVASALLLWCCLQSLAALNGWYQNFSAMPPRLFATGVGPALLLILVQLVRTSSRRVLKQADLFALTILHVVRIPVEFGLYQLATASAVPHDMTFEGRNLDILVGLTAPIVAFLFVHRGVRRGALITWNLLGLISLFNIVSMAIRATPYFSSHELFAVPNVAVFYFPWVLLPTFIVPAVFFCHVLSLVKLWSRANGSRE